jgi:hypothetical protein
LLESRYDPLKQRLGLRAISGLSRRQGNLQRVAERVARDVDLCGEASATSPEGFGFG